MQIYLDSAKLDEIKRLSSFGLIHGVTTNPSLIKKAAESMPGKPDLEDYIREIIKTSPGPVSLEVISKDAKSMYEEAIKIKEKFGKHNKNVVVKIPVCTIEDMAEENWCAGLSVIKSLALQDVTVNATLILSPGQALLAANAGAAYVSPFAGRLDDYLWKKMTNGDREKSAYYPKEGIKPQGMAVTHYDEDWSYQGPIRDDYGSFSGVNLVERIVNILKKSNSKCKVLAASIRNHKQLVEMAEVGADIATADYNTIFSVVKHPITCEGIKSFANDTIEEYKRIFKP